MLSSNKLNIYSKQILLPQIDIIGQQKLFHTRVVVVGAGGLGSWVLLNLASAGIGNILIVEYDTIQASNLNRQVLYTQSDIGKPKLSVAIDFLKKRFPNIQFDGIAQKLNHTNAEKIFNGADLVIDATDNFTAKFTINQACLNLGKTFIYASVSSFDAQIATLGFCTEQTNHYYALEQIVNLNQQLSNIPNCDNSGVLGAMVAMVASFQALQAIKYCLSMHQNDIGKCFYIDGFQNSIQYFQIGKVLNNYLPKTIEDFSWLEATCSNEKIEISIDEVLALKDGDKPLLWLDIRNDWERQQANIEDSFAINEDKIIDFIQALETETTVIIYCHYGHRSKELCKKLGISTHKVYSLQGGIDAWAMWVDDQIPRY